MTESACTRMELLIQADVDGELSPAEAAEVVAHLAGCPSCTRLQAELMALSAGLRATATLHAAPDRLRDAVTATIAARRPAPTNVPPPAARRVRLAWPGLRLAAPFGGGFAVAVCLALLLVLPRGGGLPLGIVDSHIRALQPQHLLDVVSTDQHTVKPWFDGRLDFAPPVKDLKAAGFPLAGGRLDYLEGRAVAALVYQRRQHEINLFVWPNGGRADSGPEAGQRSGYNVLRWNRGGMVFWAVSDLDARELAEFVTTWQAS